MQMTWIVSKEERRYMHYLDHQKWARSSAPSKHSGLIAWWLVCTTNKCVPWALTHALLMALHPKPTHDMLMPRMHWKRLQELMCQNLLLIHNHHCYAFFSEHRNDSNIVCIETRAVAVSKPLIDILNLQMHKSSHKHDMEHKEEVHTIQHQDWLNEKDSLRRLWPVINEGGHVKFMMICKKWERKI